MRAEDVTMGFAGFVMIDDLATSAKRAAIYNKLADEAEASDGTVFTDDEVYRALGRVIAVFGARLLDADAIKGTPAPERKGSGVRIVSLGPR